MGKAVTRLYKQFKPEHYDLSLSIDQDKKTFKGTVKIIGLKVGRPSKRLVVHQKNLKITSSALKHFDKKGGTVKIELDRVNCHKGYDELRLHSKSMLYAGKYELDLSFSGKLTDQMHGLYPCYFEHEGQKKQLIATQFESHHAREAFPCIDEPEAKATFSLTIYSPVGESVISNTPIKKQKSAAASTETTFETTPKMSTYLLAFAYGEMISKTAKTKGGSDVSVWASVAQKPESLDFGLDAGVRSLEFFEDYFGVAYPLKKTDHLALPDFSSGAMENWGLITYRESCLLADPKTSGIDTKQTVALVVSHEVSHQWFGNLVTMRWWDDLWLNESFANLMEYLAVDSLYPEWKIWEQFITNEMGMAMGRDALPNVQSVRCKVNHPDEIGTLFDPAIVYAKGGSLLHMLHSMIGDGAFRKGLKKYFEKHSYGNTEAKDLWHAISEYCHIDVDKFMDNWLNQPGYPILDINLSSDSKSVEVSQQRFLIGKAEALQTKTVWQVPFASNYKLSDDLLKKHSSTIKISDKITNEKPLILNDESKSYFIASYANKAHFNSLVETVKSGNLSTVNRLQLLTSYNLMQKGNRSTTAELLALISAYSNETEETVWSAIAGALAEARRLVVGDEQADKNLNKLIEFTTDSTIQSLGWVEKNNDSPQKIRLRSLVLSLGAGAKKETVVKEGLKRFKKFSEIEDLEANIREVVYFIGVRSGTDDDFKKLLELHHKTNIADYKDELSAALQTAKKVYQIEELLELIKTKHVRQQDVLRWFARLINNYYAKDKTWEWMSGNWQWIEEQFSDDKSYDVFPQYSAMAFSTQADLLKYREFFGPKSTNISLKRNIQLGLEDISAKVEWREKNEKEVKSWLASWATKN